MAIDKKPCSNEEPLGLLKLSRNDLKELYKMFSDTIHSKDFKNKFEILTFFEFTDGTYDTMDEPDFIEVLTDDSDIIGIKMKIVYMPKPFVLTVASPNTLEYNGNNNETIQPKFMVTLSDSEAKIISNIVDPYRLDNDNEAAKSCNSHLEHLKEDVTKYLSKKRRFTNRFIDYTNGLIPIYIISILLITTVVIQQDHLNPAENFSVGAIAFAIGLACWVLWRYFWLKNNHVIFKSEKPGIESAIRGFIERNKSNIEAGLITVCVTLVLGFLGWIFGIISIHL